MIDNNGRKHAEAGTSNGGQFVGDYSNAGDKLLKEVSDWKDIYNKLTTKELEDRLKINLDGKFVMTGQTTITSPEKNYEVYRGSDKYPQTSSRYRFVSNTNNDIVEINLDSDIQKQFDNATPKERSKIAYKYIKDNLRGHYQAKNGIEILIQESTANKISHTLFETKIRTTPQLAELIKTGKYIKTEKSEGHKLFNRFVYYEVNIKIKNIVYNALINVGVNNRQECVLYDINKFLEK